MLQDIHPHNLDIAYSADYHPDDKSIIMHYKNGKVLACSDNEHPFPFYSQIEKPQKCVYLFSVDDTKYFLAEDEDVIAPGGYIYQDIKKLRHKEGMLKVNIMVMFTSYHLWSWYTNNKICGYCGGKTVTDYNERALFCKNCCRVIYPRINPAVIVGVINGDKLLVTRYAKDRGVSYDALVAGFTEIGETFEQTVAREVHEEVGLKVKNIRYYKSQPWGYSGGILAGFYCDLDESEEITIDKTELSCAEWRTRDEITGQPDDLSLTNEMMMHFKNNMK